LKNVLVTGGAGFIGSNFVRYLLEHDPDVMVFNLDLLTYAGSPANLDELPHASRHTFIQGDISDRPLVEDLLRRHAIDTVVHLAAESHVDRSIHAPSLFVQTNIHGTFCLLEAAKRVWLEEGRRVAPEHRFHHVSTDEVYGSLTPDEPACREDRAYAPSSPYAASKAASDHLVRAYARTYGLAATISNCTNNYGSRQFPEKLIPLMILNALAGRPLPVYGDGRQIRDWIYVTDHCDALLRILAQGKPGETYHVAGENQPPNIELISLLCSILDERLPDSPHRPHAHLMTTVADRPGHDRRYALDSSKLQRELGWRASTSLAEGLRATVDWYLGHPAWLSAIRQQPSFGEWVHLNYEARGGAG
jgi:dTDP-glucose 4,6-dehydratase